MTELQRTSLLNDASLVAYYRFRSGALTTDSKASFTLTNTNSVAESTKVFGGGADNGVTSNEGFSITGSAASVWGLTNISPWSIAMWFQLNAEITAGLEYFFAWHQGNAANTVDYFCYYDFNAGTPRLLIQRNRNGVGTDQATFNVNLGTLKMHHLVVTYDAATLKLYLDNVMVASVASTGTGNNTTATATGSLGYSGAGDGLQSVYGDVPIFSRALSAQEVGVLFANPFSGGMI